MLYKSGEIIGEIKRHLPGGEVEVDYGGTIMILPEAGNENTDNHEFKMGGLLAPNGKVSKLTEEQYKLVRTPEFIAWFGDWINDPESASKVVDENREPLVVYHTTSSDFYVFNKKKSKEGFFFSPDKERLSVYNKSKTNAFFLSIKNPSHELFKTDLKYLTEKGYDGIMDYGHAKKVNENLYEIISFYPEQIKLADGSNTTFDKNNPDIRYKSGGELNLNYLLEDRNLYHILRTDAAMELLDSDKEVGSATWTEGACFPLAKALQKILGGQLKMIIDQTGRTQHVILKVGEDRYVDGDGVSSGKQKVFILKKYNKEKPGLSIVDFDEKNVIASGNGIGENGFADKIAAFLKSRIPENKKNGGQVMDMPDEKQKILSAKDNDIVTMYHATLTNYPILEEGIKPAAKSRNFHYSEPGYVYLAVNPELAAGYARFAANGAPVNIYEVKIQKEELLPDSPAIKSFPNFDTSALKNNLEDSIAYLGLARVKRKIYPDEITLYEHNYKAGGLLDYGEKIGGAKKDLLRELHSINASDIEKEPLSKSFPEPNYKKLVADGVLTIDSAILLKYLYDEIPVKPRRSYRIPKWAEKVENVIDIFKELTNKEIMAQDNAIQKVTEVALDEPYKRKQFETYKAMMTGLGFPENNVKPGIYTIVVFDKGNRMYSEATHSFFDVQTPRYTIMQKGTYRNMKDYDTMDEAIEGLKEILGATKGRAPVKFSVYTNRSTGVSYIAKQGATELVHLVDGFIPAQKKLLTI